MRRLAQNNEERDQAQECQEDVAAAPGVGYRGPEEGKDDHGEHGE
jgi:hypothetical protein